MDRLDSLANTISTMTMYDIKAMYNQARNAVLNISEMEAKVRDATNDEAWGASSTLMQEIAQGTFNFQTFNEIMPCIYGRFMEKEARQWRQIYKALQLLEYLVKHGSERVVDDARSHISTLKMLRNFHYIDDKGKDEGQNVRNRARELVELLADVETIRTERRKAKANRGKYVGTGNDSMSFTSGGSRYGGFGSDSSSGYYGDRMSGRDDYYSGGSSGGFRDNVGRRDFEEYTAGDDETVARRSSVSRNNASSRATAGSSLRTQTVSAPPASQPKEPEVDLLGGFDDPPVSAAPSTTTTTSANKALPSLTGFDDDDFADFQAAPSAPSPASPPAARPTLMEMLNSSPPTSRPSAFNANPTLAASQTQRATPPPSFNAPLNSLAAISNNRQSQSFATTMSPMPAQNTALRTSTASHPLSPMAPTPTTTSTPAATRALTATAPNKAPTTTAAPAKGLSGFEDLWSMSLGTPASSTSAKLSTTGKSIKDLEKERAQAGIWASSSQKPGGMTMGAGTTNMGLGGNAFGNFGPAKAGEMTGSGGDDLLL